MKTYGESYITKCIGALTEYPPHQIREYIFDIFHSALECTKDYVIRWFSSALTIVSFYMGLMING